MGGDSKIVILLYMIGGQNAMGEICEERKWVKCGKLLDRQGFSGERIHAGAENVEKFRKNRKFGVDFSAERWYSIQAVASDRADNRTAKQSFEKT